MFLSLELCSKRETNPITHPNKIGIDKLLIIPKVKDAKNDEFNYYSNAPPQKWDLQLVIFQPFLNES